VVKGISVAARKQKGRLMQQQVMRALLEKFPQLEPDDITSRSMGASGEDLLLSPAARKLIPYSFECKSLARFVGHNYIEQAVTNTPAGRTPVAVVKANHKKPVVIMYLDEWIKTL
jgi:hypothetical protein